jgi:hypothetical protein
MGTPIDKEMTATGVEQAISASYSQTEQYFIQHSDELMPRVHQMRTDLAQFYQSKNPSIRLQYVTKDDEKIMFLLNGTELTGREINVICRTRIGMRNILENIKQMLLKDNTIKTPIWDKIRAIKADDMADLNNAISLMEVKDQQERDAERQSEADQAKADQQHEMQLLQEKQQFEASENQKDRDAENYRAELNSAAKAATAKPPEAGEQAYLDATKLERQQAQHEDKINLEREKVITQGKLKMTDQQIQREKIREEAKRTNADITVAKINHRLKSKEPKKK